MTAFSQLLTESAGPMFCIYTVTVLLTVYVLTLYEFYYDVTCGRQYVRKIRDTHEKYGPIVRINPEEVHIQDAEYYDEIYTGATRKRDNLTLSDIAMEYAFGRSDHRMNAPDFDPSFKIAGEIGAKLGHFIKQFPWILALMKVLPDKAHTIAYPEMATHSHRSDPKYENQTIIFHEILNSDLPARKKTPARLWQYGQVTVIAGRLTTAAALSDITFYLLSQPMQLRKLKDKLTLADPSHLPTLTALEQLPYLTAVIKERLRTSSGISTRLQRIAHETSQPTQKQYILRPGIPFSMTGLLIHHSPTYFKDPTQFSPERWIENPGLDRYFVPFSRGTRQCVGTNLAYAESYLALATVFRVYGSGEVKVEGDRGWLELHNTSFEDIEIVGDGVTPLYREESKGVRVVVRG
ncbi:cytochrome P450 [Mytilinidion resinicola]|uniref:Cytochrome P450 n=1 Tax=Mytilinidion resinicola TaxID=574789 RepID=A0A6A6Y0P3_9PEZI|nr:cytochrome P450 [Mytilinidion resinicola]KAF2802219.1 cytochrome P450 [Mytilinidion resinicola]